MADIPRLNSNRGVPNPDAPRLEEQPIPRGTGQLNGMRAAGRTAPAGRVQLNTDNNQGPKSPYDVVKGRIPTQAQIKYLVREYTPDNPTPKPSGDRVFRFDGERAARAEKAKTAATQERDFEADHETLNALMAGKLAYLDTEMTMKILSDTQLMEKLESFLTYNQGVVDFTDQYEPGVYYGEGVIVLGLAHITEDEMDLHKDMRALFKLDDEPTTARATADAGATAATDATELSQPEKAIVEQLFNLYLGDEIKIDALQDVMDDHSLMLKLDAFLQRTNGSGEIVFNNTASQTVEYENGTIGMEDYHLEPKAGDENRPTIHEALRARFSLPPLTPSAPPTGAGATEGAETIEDAAETEVVHTTDNTVTTIRELWTGRVATNKDPVYPPGYVPKS